MPVTIQASKKGLARVDHARKIRGWTATAAAWCATANVSVSTLKRFREGKAIQQGAFAEICKAVGIKDWETIVKKNSRDQSRATNSQDHDEQTPHIGSSTTHQSANYGSRRDRNNRGVGADMMGAST